MSQNRSSRFMPLVVAFSVVLGILIGNFYANHFSGNRLSIINNSNNKLNDLMHLIDDQYVDPVKMPELVEKSLPEILKQLDPHSKYITAKDVEESMQDLKGSFSGIGISFTIYKDTIRVINVVKGGPSEEVGLKAGDRIVAIDGKTFVGKSVTNDEAMKKLKGAKDSKIRLSIKRVGAKNLLSFTIIRGDIPVKSIDTAYMLDKTTGYIRINTFGDTTYPELLAALAKLNHQGFKSLVIDLRGNGGGYMAPAIQMANEFLPKNSLILYTQGRKYPRENFRSDGRGTYQKIPLVVLVDETSASASEIFTGAIQDNDRGTIIGRRTYGKGLVQEPIEFPDGSMLRLTIARYYTPSGRCLQKPYTLGDEGNYDMDLYKRAEHGEYFSRDSIRTGGKKYYTRIGRTVYGGGGIIPDIFIARDSTGVTSYYQQALFSGMMFKFAFAYTDANRAKLEDFRDLPSLQTYLKEQDIPEQFANYAEKNGLKRRNLMLKRSYQLFKTALTGYIIDDVLSKEAAIQYDNQTDPYILSALEVMNNGTAFPQKTQPVKQTDAKKGK